MRSRSLDFWVYNQCWDLHGMQTNARRASEYQHILDEIPLGNDPKSREIREVCESWIRYERLMRPHLLESVVEALTAIITGQYYMKKGDSIPPREDWFYTPTPDKELAQ